MFIIKKYLYILISIVMLISSCSNNKQEYKSTIYPSELLTAEELAPFIGYTPQMTEKISRRESTASFVSDPIGKGDTVEIKVYQKNQLQSEEKVKEFFDECKEMRNDSFVIDSLGVDAFIAYPSIHYYIDGYHVKITAGSKSDNLQKALLMNLAKLSLDKFSSLTGISVNYSS